MQSDIEVHVRVYAAYPRQIFLFAAAAYDIYQPWFIYFYMSYIACENWHTRLYPHLFYFGILLTAAMLSAGTVATTYSV